MESSSVPPNKSMRKNPNQHSLKCPRCNSSNTKFCYYNNYSLSQPRHFCKTCKRYWTRGGTLRNVPVGGGVRKNKRVKQPVTSSAGLDPATISSNMNTSLFYSNPQEVNFQFSGFGSTRVSLDPNRFDIKNQMNGFGLGFSSDLIASEIQNQKRSQDFNRDDPIFIGSKFISSGLKEIHDYNFSGLMMSPFDQNMKMMRSGNGVVNNYMGKEEINNENVNHVHNQEMNGSDCFSFFGNSTNNLGSCFDPNYLNIG